MFEELNRLAGWSLTCIPEREVILISDKGVDGSFLLHHFVSLYLKAKRRVILVAAAQSFFHYNLVCAKLGVNLDRSKNSGSLNFINVLDASLNEYTEASDMHEKGDGANPALIRSLRENSMKHLYLQIKTELDDDSNAVIILDDITLLMTLGFSENDLTLFVHYMHVLCRTKNCTFVTLLHQDMIEDVDEPSLYLNIKQYSTCEILLKGLESGYCKDVHGSLVLTTKKDTDYNMMETEREMQYRLTERTLRLIPPGTSTAVL